MKKLITICIVLLFSNIAVTQDSENDEQPIVEAMAALDAFMLAFNARDPEA